MYCNEMECSFGCYENKREKSMILLFIRKDLCKETYTGLFCVKGTKEKKIKNINCKCRQSREMNMIQIACNELKKYYGTDLILENVSMEASEGDCIAIAGLNGCGKSTVLKMITGQEKCDGGSIAVRKGATVGYLEQLPQYEKMVSVNDVLWMAFEKQVAIRAQIEILESDMEKLDGNELEKVLLRYGRLCEEYESLDGYQTQERMARICSGLKIEADFLKQKFETLSGGEKTLVGLAKVLLQNPDILILDEPTNHLDLGMLQWLEEYIKAYKGTVLIVSHDRYFLDKTVNQIIEIENGKSELYLGNFSYYSAEKKRRREAQLAEYKEQQKKIKEMERAIRQMRDWAARADNESMFKRAQAMQNRLDRIDKVERPKTAGKNLLIDFDDDERSGRDVVCMENISKCFDGKELLSDFCMDIYFREHVGMIGKNGCGKTTLLNILLGKEKADSGTVKIGAGIQIGYLPQQVTFQNEDKTVLDTFREDLFLEEGKARELLAKYLFRNEQVFKKVRNLSGGEKSRLLLAKLMQKEVNFLILDEPTNHLDITARESLEEALLLFQGTILFVSHDRYFINRIATKIVEIEDKKAVTYAGDYDYCQEEKAKRIRTVVFEEKPQKKEESLRVKENPAVVEKSGNNQSTFLEKEIGELEQEIAKIREKQSRIKEQNEEWELLEEKRKHAETVLEAKMEAWLEACN